MNLLILGGTRFLGRHLVDAAQARGHRITLFNRGRSAPELFRDVEQLRGERDGGLAAIDDRDWDAVIDTCGYVPRVVRQSAERLAGHASRYLFVSSVSVYRDTARAGLNEDAAVAQLADPATEDILPNYGALKAACEDAVKNVYRDCALFVRPGLIVGPHDPTTRFSYWVARFARGGAVLAPDVPDYPVQFIDGRDLAQWMVELVERGSAGTFHATGPQAPLTLSGFFEICTSALGADARLKWVPPDFLSAQGVQPWTDLPLWAGDDDIGIVQIDITRALSAGLRLRPVESTVRDTIQWLAQRGDAAPPPGGLSPEREVELLAAWAQHASR